MKYWMTSLAAFLLTPASAQAYVYEKGPNYVNMSGSSCRTATSTTESNVTHVTGDTRNITTGVQRVFCPISRRGTSFYRGQRLPTSPPVPPEVPNTMRKVNISSVTVRGSDNSTSARFSCFVFGTRTSDQALFFGGTKHLCMFVGGCGSGGVMPSWKGTNTLQVNAPSGFKDVLSVNFGITCDLGPQSTLAYTETAVTPN